MKLRRAVLSVGFVVLAACPAAAGADDQKEEQVVAKQSAQGGIRFCNLTGQPVEVAKATYSAKRPASEAFVSEGWYEFERGQCQVLWAGKLQYRSFEAERGSGSRRRGLDGGTFTRWKPSPA
jgi:uncharacterized membrane protein